MTFILHKLDWARASKEGHGLQILLVCTQTSPMADFGPTKTPPFTNSLIWDSIFHYTAILEWKLESNGKKVNYIFGIFNSDPKHKIIANE